MSQLVCSEKRAGRSFLKSGKRLKIQNTKMKKLKPCRHKQPAWLQMRESNAADPPPDKPSSLRMSIGEILGRGMFGCVFLADIDNIHKKFAVKVRLHRFCPSLLQSNQHNKLLPLSFPHCVHACPSKGYTLGARKERMPST